MSAMYEAHSSSCCSSAGRVAAAGIRTSLAAAWRGKVARHATRAGRQCADAGCTQAAQCSGYAALARPRTRHGCRFADDDALLALLPTQRCRRLLHRSLGLLQLLLSSSSCWCIAALLAGLRPRRGWLGASGRPSGRPNLLRHDALAGRLALLLPPVRCLGRLLLLLRWLLLLLLHRHWLDPLAAGRLLPLLLVALLAAIH